MNDKNAVSFERLSETQINLPAETVTKLFAKFPNGFKICPIHRIAYQIENENCLICLGDKDYAEGNVLDKIY